MAAAGMDLALECGPGSVLAGLGKRIEPAVKVLNIFDLAGAREVAKLVAKV
jgi:malonyl CoA-acyl carrier protein transacylase